MKSVEIVSFSWVTDESICLEIEKINDQKFTTYQNRGSCTSGEFPRDLKLKLYLLFLYAHNILALHKICIFKLKMSIRVIQFQFYLMK